MPPPMLTHAIAIYPPALATLGRRCCCQQGGRCRCWWALLLPLQLTNVCDLRLLAKLLCMLLLHLLFAILAVLGCSPLL